MEEMNKGEGLSRRSFIANLAGASALGALGLAGCAPEAGGAEAAAEPAPAAGADAVAIAPPTDWLGAAPEIAETDITETKETDLLIVGAGNGGMAAAAYAASNGVDFLICEKAEQVGETRHWFAAVGTEPFESQGVSVDRPRIIGEIARYSSGTADQRLIRMFMDESNELFEFVDSIMSAAGALLIADEFDMPGGMGSTPFYTPPWEHHYAAADGGFGGPARNQEFERFINEKGNDILFSHTLAKLVGGNGSPVTGAIFSIGDSYVQINARKGVLLATGGYPANAEMLTALSPITVQCTTAMGYNPYDTGDGIKAALWAGAVKDLTSATMIFDRGLVPPGTKAGYVEGSVASGNAQWPGVGQFNPSTQPFLKVNVKGERFINESGDYDYPTHAAAQLPNGTYNVIWDAHFGDDVQRFHTLGCSAMTRNMVLGFSGEDGSYDLDAFFERDLENGGLIKADTLEDLADQLFLGNTDYKANFLATCERYNELYDAQKDTDFGKEAYRLSELRTPPFFAAHVGGTLLTTIDGVRINSDCQALDAKYEPIEGLYCAGDCSGSVFSGNYPDQLHGFACGRTMTEALHVVKQIMAK